MNDQPVHEPDTLPFAVADEIDRACNRFEAEWTAGRRPLIEDILVDADEPRRGALLRELLASDLECRRRRGESPTRAEYLARFPHDAQLVELAFAEPSSAQPTRLEVSTTRERSPASWPAVSQYEILDELGRGGMGVVYLARHRQLGRLVALKMVLAGEFAGSAARARFRSEARAAARLQHPGVVQIFDVLEQDGRPYVVLEYVAGGSLAQRLASAPLPAREAARIVEALAQAMEYAHQQGIVHRDLKPSNILLTPDGEPKVTDFGLAKALDDESGLTRSESIIGSPSYMAPEQAHGWAKRVGPAADVYSLGSILYEAVAGRPPFKSATVLETLEQVKFHEPVPPGQLARDLPRDLETICMACLRKEPTRRYRTASALAEDLGRFRRGESVRARPVHAAERTWRWARRRPAVASLLAALVVTIAAGFCGVAVLWLRAERLRGTADANLADARAAVDECFTIAEREPLLQRPGLQPVRRLLLGAALKYYHGFLQRRADSPSLQTELARNYARVGTITAAIGSAPEALTAHRKAVELLERLAADQPESPELRRDLARSYHEAALLEEAMGMDAEALRSIARALALRERLDADRTRQDDDRNKLAQSLQLLGDLEYEAGRPNDAVRTYKRATELREQLVAQRPANVAFRHDLASTLSNLGVAQRALGIAADAMRSLTSATEILQSLADREPENVVYHNSLAKALSDLAIVQADTGRNSEAQRSYDRAEVVLERLVLENPRVTDYRRELTVVLLNSGGVHYACRRLPEAQILWNRAAQAAATVLANHPEVAEFRNDLARIHNNLGALYFTRNQPEAALSSWEKAAKLRERLVDDHPGRPDWRQDLAGSLNNMAIIQRDIGKTAAAAQSWSRAVEIREQLVAGSPSVQEYRRGLAEVLGALGGLQRRMGRMEEASNSLRRARAIGVSLVDPRPDDLYTLAYVEAQCATLVSDRHPKLIPAELTEQHSLLSAAMASLRRAVQAGFTDLKQLQHDADLDPLRSRADFQTLIMDVAFPAEPFAG
jgi:serine/threonine-protein kinase